jgi:hypothetical protein
MQTIEDDEIIKLTRQKAVLRRNNTTLRQATEVNQVKHRNNPAN